MEEEIRKLQRSRREVKVALQLEEGRRERGQQILWSNTSVRRGCSLSIWREGTWIKIDWFRNSTPFKPFFFPSSDVFPPPSFDKLRSGSNFDPQEVFCFRSLYSRSPVQLAQGVRQGGIVLSGDRTAFPRFVH